MKKQIFTALLLFSLILPVTSASANASGQKVPLRALSESASADVFWDASRRAITVYKGLNEIIIFPDTQTAERSGVLTEELGIHIENGRVFIDSAFAEKLLEYLSDASVEYSLDESGNAVKTPKDKPTEQAGSVLTAMPWSDEERKVFDKLDTQYAYDLAVKITGFGDSPFGGRTAGSDAELEIADMLANEMKAIGLKNVNKDSFTVDKWQFNDAYIEVDGIDKKIGLYSYASGETAPEGLDAEIIYLGKGTAADYEGIDAAGKIVLVDVDLHNEWIITYPTLEAALHGAVALIAANTEGYGRYDGDTYYVQDFCGPVTIPSLCITVNDADLIKKTIKNERAKAHLFVDNDTEKNSVSYNVWGEIPGESDEVILVGDHYDGHFTGFTDNATGAAHTLALAKAMLGAGYRPQRTLRFILHGAEEYGRQDTPYDWSIGAWEQINTNHPEWVGETLAYINFEETAYQFSDKMYVASTYQLQSWLDGFIAAANPAECFSGGIEPRTILETSWADNFSYSEAGVPSLHPGILNDENGDMFPFYLTHYHTNHDTKSLYDGAAYLYQMKFYAALVIALDQTPYLELDLSRGAKAMLESLENVEDAELINAVNDYYMEACRRVLELRRLNLEYFSGGQSPEEMREVWENARQANARTLAYFKSWQDALLRLSWGQAQIFPHEETEENVSILRECAESLKAGDAEYALELLQGIDSGRAAGYFFFSKEVGGYFTDYTLKPFNEHNYWGTGRITGVCEGVDELIYMLLENPSESLENETALVETLLDKQEALLKEQLDYTKTTMKKLSERELIK